MSMSNEPSSVEQVDSIESSPAQNSSSVGESSAEIKENVPAKTEPNSEESAEMVAKISTTLTEPNTELITRIVNELGIERSQHIFDKALVAEETGGIMTRDGKRRRTPGGTFFFLVRGRISREQYFRIWERPHPFYKKPKRPARPPRKKPPTPKKKAEPLQWPARIALFNEVSEEHGQASTTEIKLIGRPIKVLPRGKVVILTLRNRDQPPLPRGLPKVEEDMTVFLVFLTLKQWKKIADSMEEASDKVIVTGYPVFSAKLNAIAVWAKNATTINMEKARYANKK